MDLGPPVMSAQVFAADFYYSPSALSLKVGGTVEWFFEGIHDVVFTSGSGAEPSDCPRGVTSCSRTFDVAGAFTYRCTLPGHDAMVGSVTVVP
jgi:plastocyanin